MNKKRSKDLRILKAINKMYFSSDTFVCDRCGNRKFLKIYGDTAPCNECGGTMRRVK
jgi:hypothetical protein